MLNSTKTIKNRSQSKFLGQRRISFLSRRSAKIGFNFIRINRGSVTVSKMPIGSYKTSFKSIVTGRTAFAYGQNFHEAYHNMIRLFNLKYAV